MKKATTKLLKVQGSSRKGENFFYEDKEHRLLPHIVKFSGGRSSGMMLLQLLRMGVLRRSRGDVVLFTNTSAEHSATYDFVHKIKEYSEKHDIPFHIAEFQTHETVVSGTWRRKPAYRLAHTMASSHRFPEGLSVRGEVFEEMVAWLGILPSVHMRVCTSWLKLFTTRAFLSDWFSVKENISYLGHPGPVSRVNIKDAYAHYLQRRGTMEEELFYTRYKYLASRPTFRPSQQFSNFSLSGARHCNEQLKNSVAGGKCELFGERAARFVTMLGFRSDEPWRYIRMCKRNCGEEMPGQATQPLGEYSYAPLFLSDINKRDVLWFWRRQPKSLRPNLPEDTILSNCVYCFMKGQDNLAGVEEHRLSSKTCNRQKNTPENFRWWVRLEETYRRHSWNGRFFGFLGKDRKSYREMGKELRVRASLIGRNRKDFSSDASMACECTD